MRYGGLWRIRRTSPPRGDKVLARRELPGAQGCDTACNMVINNGKSRQMSEIIKCEDVLNGIAVDWRGYEPPGGEGWRKYYDEQLKPLFAKSRIDAEAEINRCNRIIADNRSTIFAADKIKAIAEQTLSCLPDSVDAADKAISAAFGNISAQCALIAENLAARRGAIEKAEQGIKVCEEDIRFFDLFREYSDADAELDRLLFAMSMVDLKYRAKILRACVKLLNVVETRREGLRRSKSVVFKQTKTALDPIIKKLDEAYAVTGITLRLQMKDFKKNGIKALRDIEDIGRFFRRNPAAVKRISAAVTAAANAKS